MLAGRPFQEPSFALRCPVLWRRHSGRAGLLRAGAASAASGAASRPPPPVPLNTFPRSDRGWAFLSQTYLHTGRLPSVGSRSKAHWRRGPLLLKTRALFTRGLPQMWPRPPPSSAFGPRLRGADRRRAPVCLPTQGLGVGPVPTPKCSRTNQNVPNLERRRVSRLNAAVYPAVTRGRPCVKGAREVAAPRSRPGCLWRKGVSRTPPRRRGPRLGLSRRQAAGEGAGAVWGPALGGVALERSSAPGLSCVLRPCPCAALPRW